MLLKTSLFYLYLYKKNMKLYLIFFLLAFNTLQAQYKKTYKPNSDIVGLTKVKSIAGSIGYINAEGKEVIPVIYKKIYKLNQDHPNWIKVKSLTGNYGYVTIDGKEVVPAIYKQIHPFNKHVINWALVETVSGHYGFIDKSGKIAVKALYSLPEIKEKYINKI